MLANERAIKNFQEYSDNLLEDMGMDEEISVLTNSLAELLNESNL